MKVFRLRLSFATGSEVGERLAKTAKERGVLCRPRNRSS